MGRCARLAWDDAVEANRSSPAPRPGVTTGHILLGVLKHEDCAGGLILGKMGLDFKLACLTTEFVLFYGRPREGAAQPTVDYCGVPHTPLARRLLDLCVEEANLTSPTFPIGTEHLLLTLLRVPEGIGGRVLHYFGISEPQARAGRDGLWEVLHLAREAE